jgi:hypothetical protein
MIREARPLFLSLLFIISFQFLFSSSALISLGFPPNPGNPVLKVHPAVWLLWGSFAFFVHFSFRLSSTRTLPHYITKEFFAYLVVMIAIMIFVITFHGGNNFSFFLETHMTPAALGILLYCLPPHYRSRLFQAFVILLCLNAAVGFFEGATGTRLFPMYIMGERLQPGSRPSALLGHPLSNSFTTALGIFFIIASNHKYRTPLVIFLGLSLIAFGGRTALFGFILFGLILLGIVTLRAIYQQRLTYKALALGTGLACIGPFIVMIIFLGTTFGQVTLDRLEWDDSSEARVTSVRILESLSTSEWLTGIPMHYYEQITAYYGLDWGIENSWVVMILRFGIVMFAFFVAAFVYLLRFFWKQHPLPGKLGILLFVLLCTSNNCLTGKGSTFSLFVLMASTSVAYRQVRAQHLGILSSHTRQFAL